MTKSILSEDIDIVAYNAEEANASTFIFSFEIDIEYRDWGIKSIALYAPKLIYGTITLKKDNNYPDPQTEIEIDCTDFEIKNNVEIDSDQITINEVHVNIKEKTIFIS